MKVDNIEVYLRNSDGESVIVKIDLFYREIAIYRPGVDSSIFKAIGAKIIQQMAFEVSTSGVEASELIRYVWGLMDPEGKNIMESGIPNIIFGE
ncbi:hypothetical protein CPT_Melville_061 [Salmonella phage Melville]|uniref:Uncharacterized protein n=1 Tax=Salmonella phage Melville TaxID=2041413 RepID=A0A2D1GM52_9CAUD|nr:hypothetical protein FDI73_gp061 [Salmonella phage Melville]ATN93035.1 hypothetical protein CPT_Melville_061 [Salmonella phage Melville]